MEVEGEEQDEEDDEEDDEMMRRRMKTIRSCVDMRTGVQELSLMCLKPLPLLS